MKEGHPSETAQRVATYRLAFERLPADFGNPVDDDRLAEDVASDRHLDANQSMARYLQARTSFFDRVVVEGVRGGARQVLAIASGYDGRAMRYAHDGVRWFEIDHPDTQTDKLRRIETLGLGTTGITFVSYDLTEPGLADAVLAAGFNPAASTLMICEGLATYLDLSTLTSMMKELRVLSIEDTRLAISISGSTDSEEAVARRQQLRATMEALGEPALSTLTAESSLALFDASGWRPVEVSEAARRVGFVVLAPTPTAPSS